MTIDEARTIIQMAPSYRDLTKAEYHDIVEAAKKLEIYVWQRELIKEIRRDKRRTL